MQAVDSPSGPQDGDRTGGREPSERRTRAATDDLRITVHLEGGHARVELDGDLCAFTAPYLDWHLQELRAQAIERVTIDCARVRCLSARGIDVLADHAGAGLALSVVSPSDVTRRVLAACELDHLVPTG